MAITFPYSGSAHNSATLSFTTSSDVVSGDVIWCMIGINLTGNTITPPSGFTELTLSGGNNTAGNLAQIRIYYNLSPAASTTYNATHGGSGRSDLAWIQVRGSDNTSLANHVNTSVGGAKTVSETPVSDSITTTNATTTLLGFVGFRAFPVNGVAPGTGFTEIIDSVGADSATNIRQEFASKDVTSTGSYTYTVTLNAADGEPTIIGVIALNPASGGAQSVTAAGIRSGEQLGAANVSPVISGSGITTGEKLGAAQVSANYTINANGITSTETLGNPAITTTYTINANGIASGERLGSTALGALVAASGVTSSEKLGSPAISLTVNPSGIPTAEAVGSPTVQPGAITINVHGIASAQALGATVVMLAQSINANGIISRETLGTPTITPGSVTVNLSGIGSGGQVGAPTVSSAITITAHGIRSTEQLGSTTLYSLILSSGVVSSEKVGSPTITLGAVTINASGIVSSTGLGSPTLITLPLVPPTPDTWLKMRNGQTILTNDAGQTILTNDAGQTNMGMNDSETLIVI